MNPRRKAFTPAALSFAAALLLAHLAASAAHAQQTPRRPAGPAAGPVIKLPPGSGARLEETQADARRQDARAASEPKRWEYCAIVGFKWEQKGFPSTKYVPWAIVRFFPNTFEDVEGTSEEDAIANAVARLGEDGWEMTGISTNISLTDGNGKTAPVYFFKRPKRQQQEQ